MDYSFRAISSDRSLCYVCLSYDSKMLLGIIFLIHSFGLVKVEGLNGSSRNLGYSPGDGVRTDEERYYEYRRDKNNPETSYITISIFTKLKLGSVLTDPRKLWINGSVPFSISKNCSRKQKKTIFQAMKRFKIETCVRFIPRKNEPTFITITPGRRCRTGLGNRKDTEQTVAEGCFDQGDILNELMYVLDFSHGQNKLGGKNNFITLQKGDHIDPRRNTSNINTAKINYMYGCNRKESIGSRNRINGRPLELSHEMSRSFRRKRYLHTPKAEYVETTRPQLYPKDTTPSVQESTLSHVIPTEVTEIQSTTNNPSIGVSDTSDSTDSSDTSTGGSDSSDSSTSDSDTSDSTDSNFTAATTKESIGTTVGNVVTTRNDETNEGNEDSTVSSHSEEYHKVKIFGTIDSRAALSYPTKLWDDGVIPYVLSDEYDAIAKGLLLNGMEEFHNNTCVKFIERKDEETYIFIRPGTRCSATIGKVDGGVNNVTLSEGCFSPGTIVHELMHVMGFIHEQNRPDRDSYVMIIWDNIIPRAISNFRKKEKDEVMDFGVGYDYESVMHYGQYDFAINQKRPTIVPLQPGVKIGQRDGFSKKDLMKINKLFSCNTEEGPEARRNDPSATNFGKKFLEYVRNLFRAIYRALLRFNTNPNDSS